MGPGTWNAAPVYDDDDDDVNLLDENIDSLKNILEIFFKTW
jgi:hypothetical protein